MQVLGIPYPQTLHVGKEKLQKLQFLQSFGETEKPWGVPQSGEIHSQDG